MSLSYVTNKKSHLVIYGKMPQNPRELVTQKAQTSLSTLAECETPVANVMPSINTNFVILELAVSIHQLARNPN